MSRPHRNMPSAHPERRFHPGGLLAIGDDPGGNLICIGLKGERKGKIYWWERTKEGSRPTLQNVYLLADSLPEFIDSLYPSED